MKLTNIHNSGRLVYKFIRPTIDNLIIEKDDSFYPYFYEPSQSGEYTSFDGESLAKVVCSAPKDVRETRSPLSYESDVLFNKRYLIDKIDRIDKGALKYLMFDIEVTTDVLPDYKNPKQPISCITLWNNADSKYVTFLASEYKSEQFMLAAFMDYIAEEQPDMLLAWNISFDYNYLYARIMKFEGKRFTFAHKISPVGKIRYGKDGLFYPIGISVVDYMGLYHKFTLGKKRSYALDKIAQDDLGFKPWGKTDFSEEDSERVKEKNIEDVKKMVELEKKFKVLPYFDEIRIYSKCLWEDLPFEIRQTEKGIQKTSNNSKIVDQLILQEAKNQKIILPSKSNDLEKEEYDGAFREAFDVGRFFKIGKYDLGSAYPNALINFCLDPSNLVDTHLENTIKIDVTDRVSGALKDTYYFEQKENGIVPKVMKKLLEIKDKLKKELNSLDKDSDEYEKLMTKYNAIKAMVNSIYGVLGNRFFRLYKKEVAETVTFLVRDLLYYVKEKLELQGYGLIYIDTDSVFIDSTEDISDKLNKWVQEWGEKKYGNKNVTIEFDYEGQFDRILILSKCHYYGYMEGSKKPEIKGIEVKRSSSSKYEAYFQKNLIEKILNKESELRVIKWIKEEQVNIKKQPLFDIGFPVKINSENYINEPVQVKSFKNTKEIYPDFQVNMGELFYYMFVKDMGLGKEKVAFKDEYYEFLKPKFIHWDNVIKRSIFNKAEKIFEAMKWDVKSVLSKEEILF